MARGKKGISVEEFWKLVDKHFGKNKHYLSVREVNEIKARFGVPVPAAVLRSRVRPGYEDKVVRPGRGRPRKNAAGAVVITKPASKADAPKADKPAKPVVREKGNENNSNVLGLANKLVELARASNMQKEAYALRYRDNGAWVGDFLQHVGHIAFAKITDHKPNVSNKGAFEIVRVKAGYVVYSDDKNSYAKFIAYEEA